MCQKCEKRATDLTPAEVHRLTGLARDLSQAMLQGIELAGFRPGSALDFCAVHAAAKAVADAFGSTMGPAMLGTAAGVAETLTKEKLAAIGYSAEGSH
jgi:hypothetical protein